MNWTALLRSSPALYIAPVAVALTILYYDDLSKYPSSWVSVFTAPADLLFLPAMLGAGIAAWDVGRLRKARIDTWGGARSVYAATAQISIPAVTLALGTLLLMWGMGISRMSMRPFNVSWQPVLVLLLVVIMWTVVGALAGWRLNRFFAMPSMAALAFLLEAYPPSVSDPFWRNLSGWSWSECCDIGSSPVSELFLASVIWPCAVIVGGIVLLRRPAGPVRSLSALVVVTLGLGVSGHFANGIGWAPVQKRDTAEQVCIEGGFEICMWPESEEFRPAVERSVEQTSSTLALYGVELPRRVVESPYDSLSEWNFRTSPVFSEEVQMNSILSGAVSEPGDCVFHGDDLTADDITEFEVASMMRAWVNIVVLESTVEEELAQPWGPPIAQQGVADVLSLEPVEQGVWFGLLRSSLQECDYRMVLEALALVGGGR